MKGEATRSRILDTALRLASLEGLEALSIGKLAARSGLSKSGLFAHFNSKQVLQKRVLEHAAERFIESVVMPAIGKKRGMPRLRSIFDNWLAWASSEGLPGGCVFVAAAAELDDKPGPVRDYLVRSQQDWIATLSRAVAISQEEGDVASDADPEQLAFELYGVMMSYHLYRRLLGNRSAKTRAQASFARITGN
ncbi:MAG: TetR/AcrR family transcriptional regulator [Planctomycetales bacterium]|nr:TetR/AcrR family transcriptional regulator [Planctomycetales bacterium]